MCWGADGSYTRVFINNAVPRKDLQATVVDAHDGCLRYFGGKYFLYGTRYGNTDGSGNTNRYVVYSSPNLQDWTDEGVILKNVRPGVYYRPYVVYNQSTKKYVLWFNGDLHMGVATADEPTGPFTQISGDVALSHRGLTGDLGTFVDADGRAYITYSYLGSDFTEDQFAISKEPIPFGQIFVEELTVDYLASTGHVTGPIAGNSEAPALFRRGEFYYLLFDNTCSFCTAGTGVRVYMARSPLGPFMYRGNINRVSPSSRDLPSPWTYPGTGRPDAIIKAQQTDIAVLPGRKGDVYLWVGDRWHSSTDSVKGHDFQHWAVLSFDSDGMIQQLENRDSWEFEIMVKE